MRIFMTGATGFIGSYVAYEFLGAGHELVLIARDPHKLLALSSHPRVRRVTATLNDTELIREALKGAEACVHVALGWGDTPLEMLKNDTLASVSLLQSALSAGVKKFIYTSSTAALGPFFASMDESAPPRPSDYYGATKAATEAYVLAVGAHSSMLCNVIRPGYTFGNPVVPGATTQPDRRFHRIAERAKRGQEISLDAGDGTQFVWAGDLARLYRALLDSDRTREVYYGLGTQFVSWQQIAERARALANSRSPITLHGQAHAPHLFDLAKIERDFGLKFASAARIDEHLEYLIEHAE
jgi:UDP-glucose 4-epimerase